MRVFVHVLFVRSVISNKRSTGGGEMKDDPGSKKARCSSGTGVLPQVSEPNADKSANKDTGGSGTLYRDYMNCWTTL